MPKLDTYLFDLDGTLIDSLALILNSYRHTLTVHRGVAPADEVWKAGIGTPLRTQLAPFADDAADVERMVATFRDYNFTNHDAMLRPFPGIRHAVSALKTNGTNLGIVTSKARKGTLKGLHTCGLTDLFETIVAADDVDKHKPDPTPVFRALELLNADAASTVFIGDSRFDMAAGRDAGVRTAAALWGPFERSDLEPYDPNYWLEEPEDIVNLETKSPTEP